MTPATSLTEGALSDGPYAYHTLSVDTAGNVSVASPTLSANIDTVAPSDPAAPDLQSTSDKRASNFDNYTNATTPTFDVSSTDSFFRFFRDGNQLSGGYATGSSFTVTTTGQGVHGFGLQAVDTAGNVSNTSSSLNVTVDTAAADDYEPGNQSFEIVNTAGRR